MQNEFDQAITSNLQHEDKALSNLSVNAGSQLSTKINTYIETVRILFNAFVRFLVKQSYLLSLLTMMVIIFFFFLINF